MKGMLDGPIQFMENVTNVSSISNPNVCGYNNRKKYFYTTSEFRRGLCLRSSTAQATTSPQLTLKFLVRRSQFRRAWLISLPLSMALVASNPVI